MIDGAPAIRHDALLICGFPVGSHVARGVYGINVALFPFGFLFFFKPALVLSRLFTYLSDSVSSSGLAKLDKLSWARLIFPSRAWETGGFEQTGAYFSRQVRRELNPSKATSIGILSQLLRWQISCKNLGAHRKTEVSYGEREVDGQAS